MHFSSICTYIYHLTFITSAGAWDEGIYGIKNLDIAINHYDRDRSLIQSSKADAKRIYFHTMQLNMYTYFTGTKPKSQHLGVASKLILLLFDT